MSPLITGGHLGATTGAQGGKITNGELGPVVGANDQTSIATGTKTTVAPPIAGAGQVGFYSPNPPLALVCSLGETSATPSAGGGGWETFERPGRKQGQEWKGYPLKELSIPILIDRVTTMESIEPEIRALESMWVPPGFAQRGTTPPILTLTGMVPHYGLRWVITDISYGDATYSPNMFRVRLYATVQVREWEPTDLVVVSAASPTTAPKTKSYTIKKGDTLGQIARKEMGAKTAAEIQAAVAKLKSENKIRDSKALKPGDKIKIPKVSVTPIKGDSTGGALFVSGS